jgi:drug/metabolite transporter (DMT)-like permease
MKDTLRQTVLQSSVGVRLRLIWRTLERLPPNARGIATMLGAMAAFAIGDAVMKLQAGRMPLGESLFLRGLMATALIWYVASRTGALVEVSRLFGNKFLVWRTLGDSAASFFYIAALGKVPLADAGAIMQTNPLAVTAGAALFLGERVGWRRWTATAVGFLGVLLIIQPGSTSFSWASLLVIGAVLTSAGRDLITRRLDNLPTLVVTGSAAAATTVISLMLLPFETWHAPAFFDLVRLAIAAVCVLIGQALVVISIRSGDVSAVVPFRYSAILWTLILSVLIWGYVPNFSTLAGIVIVSGAGLYAFYREQSLRRQGLVP